MKTREIFEEQRELIKSSAMTVREAGLAFDETLERLGQYDKRLAAVEAQRARRQRWRDQVAFLKELEDHEPRKERTETYGSYEEEHDDYAEPSEDHPSFVGPGGVVPPPPPPPKSEPSISISRESFDAAPPPVFSEEEIRDAREIERSAAEDQLRMAEKALISLEPSFFDEAKKDPDDALGFLNRLVFGEKKEEDPREEAAGWLHEKRDDWKRRWFVLKQGEFGPYLESAVAPGSPPLARILLAACDVVALDDDGSRFFSFCIAHPHQKRRDLCCVNIQTRKQWVSVLGQLIRDHAKADRAKDTAFLDLVDPSGSSTAKKVGGSKVPNALALAKLKHHKAKQRIDLLNARTDADD